MSHPPEYVKPPYPVRDPTKGLGGHKLKVMKEQLEKAKLTAEELAAGKTPNSGKVTPKGKPVPGQTPEADARRAVERAADKADEDMEPEAK